MGREAGGLESFAALQMDCPDRLLLPASLLTGPGDACAAVCMQALREMAMSYANSEGLQDNSYGKDARDAAIWTNRQAEVP